VRVVAGITVGCLVAACSGPASVGISDKRLVAPRVRNLALSRARVWHEPAVPIERVDLSRNPPGPFGDSDDVVCAFVTEAVGGTTPKFHCRTRNGLDVKVKYGADNPELPAEIAASRLLLALGFPVDRVFRVRSVRCFGCPTDPYSAMQCLEGGGAHDRCLAGASPSEAVVFANATVELPFEGARIESTPDQGWSWYELDLIDPHAGGAPRSDVDALRVMAVLLSHWDNKGSNQRLLCPTGMPLRDGACAAPVAIIQDLGATFGPLKLDLPNWQHTTLWSDARSCVLTMKTLPYGGGTFGEHVISEEGRQLALRLLHRLSADQIRALFASSGATQLNQVVAAAHDPESWTAVFFAKVRAIEAAGPCPSQ